jgi:hypothetical protein
MHALTQVTLVTAVQLTQRYITLTPQPEKKRRRERRKRERERCYVIIEH